MKISCRNSFCIYFKADKCILDFISVDEMGFCEKVLFVNLDESFLSIKRKELLKKFEQLNS